MEIKNNENNLNEKSEEVRGITKKKYELIDNVVKGFDEDEVLIDSFNTWAYSEDTARVALAPVSRAAAMPMMNWSKITLFILSNKRLYLVGATDYMDHVKTETIDLIGENNLESLDIYKKGEDEVLILKLKGHKSVQFKTNKEKFTKLYGEIRNIVNEDKIKYHDNEEAEMPSGKKAIIVENWIYVGVILAFFLLVAIGIINY
ncbi:hypothetical protein ACQPU1_14305 [Clostridium paraputrificum]|uniref:hypothetical protein n=1 Tax=Clostridium paraputrificum TaxID=29363 RepID=UPI003D34B365